jgi:hypothetical protein
MLLKLLPAQRAGHPASAAVGASKHDSFVFFASPDVSGQQTGWNSSALH